MELSIDNIKLEIIVFDLSISGNRLFVKYYNNGDNWMGFVCVGIKEYRIPSFELKNSIYPLLYMAKVDALAAIELNFDNMFDDFKNENK